MLFLFVVLLCFSFFLSFCLHHVCGGAAWEMSLFMHYDNVPLIDHLSLHSKLV